MAPASAKGSAKGGLGRKVGPLPLYVWLLLGAAVGYLVWRHGKMVGGAGTTSGNVGAEVVSGNTTATPVDAALAGQPSTNYAPANQIDPSVLDSLLGSGSPLVTALNGNADAAAAAASGGGSLYATSTGDGSASNPGGQTAVATPGTQTGGYVPTTTVATTKPATPAAAAAPAFGGIVSKIKTKTGATITTYANGRKVEQAPGHSPYVIVKGR